MPPIDVADVIGSRLGEPTVTALKRRFGPGGRCLTCGSRLGSAPLSVGAYHDGRETVTLLAYHARCAGSAWLDAGGDIPSCEPTYATATAAVSLPLGRIRPLRWLRGAGSRAQTLPVMFVQPSLEAVHVRQVCTGEAVNADLEKYSRLGFAELGDLAVRLHPLRPVAPAWLRASGRDVSIAATAGDRVWSTPALQPPVADLIKDHAGIMIAITCDHDPRRLSIDAGYRDLTLGNGEILLGWAQLSAPPRPMAVDGDER